MNKISLKQFYKENQNEVGIDEAGR